MFGGSSAFLYGGEGSRVVFSGRMGPVLCLVGGLSVVFSGWVQCGV